MLLSSDENVVMVETSRRNVMKMKTRVTMNALKHRQKRLERRNGSKSKRDVDLGLLPSPYVDADPDGEHDASEDKADDNDTIPIAP
jgi:hypothetical protein